MQQRVETGESSARAMWMSVLARAKTSELEDLAAGKVLPTYEIIRSAETGTLMVEGRAGGGGRRFNTGEATVTRCVVRVGETLGFSYALGREKRKAELSALLDAMLQDDAALVSEWIEPLRQAQARARAETSRRTAATKVEFFTLVRGDG